MIELNLTYEESKKILELGYDFSKICTEWQDRELSTPCITDKYKLPETAYPIIPKAALEACLPELSGSTWLKNLKTNWIILDLDPHIVKLESIFEAFIWCHEHHPEELKKKFEEVMG